MHPIAKKIIKSEETCEGIIMFAAQNTEWEGHPLTKEIRDDLRMYVLAKVERMSLEEFDSIACLVNAMRKSGF